MIPPQLQAIPPCENRITEYDERHFSTYLRLLDAEIEAADWKEAARLIFAIDPDSEPELARRIYDTHLDRAHWMTSHGYRHLLNKTTRLGQ